MSDCIVPGWGTGPWGITPWGGQPSEIGGPLPTTELFDIYCFGPCGPMSGILTHAEVSAVENGAQISIDGATLDLVVESGGLASSDDAQLYISTPVPEKFTLEWTVFFAALPPNFNSLTSNHLYFGVSDASGAAVGLFFSRVGVAYSGSIHMNAGDLALDGPFQLLPGSAGLISEGDYFTIRVAVDGVAGVVYIYITRTAELHTIGHQLRFILPVLESSTMAIVPPDQTMLSVRGTPAQATAIGLDTICLGNGLLIPNIVPFADAGIDQAVQRCTVAQLDGSRSFDPEGAPLAYRWRLIDAPLTSQYLFHGLDGATQPQDIPTGFTDRFYSDELGAAHALDPVVAGDVLVVAGAVYVVESVGTDGVGFYARIQGYILPDSYASIGFKYLRQRGISGAATVKPTFYPDVAGLYRFDLTVFDGSLFSEPAVMVLNVTESPVARGITPDVRFLWSYLSDFWRLVEDSERLEVYWSGLAQVAAAELLTLWQIDYSKSLRDVQRTAQRRWLHYDFAMQEGLPELSTVRVLYSGIESIDIPPAGLGGVAGHHVDFTIPTSTTPFVVSFSGAGNLTAADLQTALQAALYAFDTRIKVTRVVNRLVSGTERLRVDAPFELAIASSTDTSLFGVGSTNGLLSGTGSTIGPRSYRADRSLLGMNIQENDFLVLDALAYRIARVVDHPADQFPFQRVSLLDEMPVPAPSSFAISGQATSKTLDFAAGLVTAGDPVSVEVLTQATGDLLEVSVPALGTSSALPSDLALDATVLGRYLADPSTYSVFVRAVVRRTYLPLDPLVVDIPYLQEKIRSTDDTAVLRRNVDYFLETRFGAPCVRFVTANSPDPDVWQYGQPPARMWAEITYLDNRPTIEANFGIPAGFTLDDLAALPSHVDYLSCVRGLWYAYFNGPTLFNLKAGTQILLGLPFAEEAGTIEEVRTDFSATHGRILVRDTGSTAIVRSYTYPAQLSLETNPATGQPYKVGDAVAQFAPLVTGVDVDDWVKTPQWFGGYLQQGVFYEVEKFFKFLVRVDSTAFNLAALLFVQSFVRRVKPTYTFPLFVVLQKIGDTEISTSDTVTCTGHLLLNDLGVTNNAFGMSTMIDEGHPAGGGWRSQLDTDSDPTTGPPTYPTSQLVLWGSDKNYLAPEDAIVARCSMVMPHLEPPFFTGGTPSSMPFLDGIFRIDLPLYVTSDAVGLVVFEDNHVYGIPAGPTGYVMELNPTTSTVTGTFNYCQLDISGDPGDTAAAFELVLEKNGSDVVTQAFTVGSGGIVLGFAVSVAVVPTDQLRARIRPQAAGVRRPYWHQVTVQLYRSVAWALDTAMPDGTYGSLRAF